MSSPASTSQTGGASTKLARSIVIRRGVGLTVSVYLLFEGLRRHALSLSSFLLNGCSIYCNYRWVAVLHCVSCFFWCRRDTKATLEVSRGTRVLRNRIFFLI